MDFEESRIGVLDKVDQDVELSVVIPCLNEAQTIQICVEKAIKTIEELGIAGEVIVADNGSSDHSEEIAARSGARVVYQPNKGYGNAYLKGISEARGKYIVIADADNTYDFCEIGRFIEPLKNGYDLVMGSRFKGRIEPGAMPWHHRYIGNPVLTGILNQFFKVGVSDAHCGMRSFTREAIDRMHLQTTGMEFAAEMVINASKAGLRITEVPITYYRRAGESKLRSFSDGWRHLRFMLLYSPTHLFMWPGVVMMILGFLLMLALLPGPLRIGGLVFDFHWMFPGSLLMIVGYQVISLALYARFYSLTARFDVGRDRILEWFVTRFRLEQGLLAGLLLLGAGLVINLGILIRWLSTGFGELFSVRSAILALTLFTIGTQTIFSAFFLSLMTIQRKNRD